MTPSDGSVFAELGLPDAEELLAKSTIAMKINQIIEIEMARVLANLLL